MSTPPDDDGVPFGERPTVRMHRVKQPDACPICHGRGTVPPEISDAVERAMKANEKRK